MIGSELKDWRDSRNLLQGELAEMLGVHEMTISKWEREAQAIPPFLHLALKCLKVKKPSKKNKTS